MRKSGSEIAQDWHAEQVKAAIRMRGETLASLSTAHGYEESAFSKALKRQWPTVELIIASFLDLSPKTIWPSRYDRSGRPKRQQSNGKRMVNARLRQKSQAA